MKNNEHLKLYQKGLSLSKEGKYEEAINCFDKSLELKPEWHEALNGKKDTLKSQGDYFRGKVVITIKL